MRRGQKIGFVREAFVFRGGSAVAEPATPCLRSINRRSGLQRPEAPALARAGEPAPRSRLTGQRLGLAAGGLAAWAWGTGTGLGGSRDSQHGRKVNRNERGVFAMFDPFKNRPADFACTSSANAGG